MAKPKSTEIRILLIAAVFEHGYSRHAAAKLFKVSVSSAVRWCRRKLECGKGEPRRMGGDRRSRFSKRDRGKIRRWLEKKPDTTLDEIRVRLAAQGLEVSNGTIRRLLVREGLSWKKKTGHASEQEREDVQELRRKWEETRKTLAGQRLLFFDEMAVFTNRMRLRGWSPVGEPCLGSFPFGHRNTTTLIAALCPEGMVAPRTLDGALDSNAFRAWVQQVLVKELRQGDVVVCDNLPVHKISGISKLIEDAGAKLIFLPP